MPRPVRFSLRKRTLKDKGRYQSASVNGNGAESEFYSSLDYAMASYLPEITQLEASGEKLEYFPTAIGTTQACTFAVTAEGASVLVTTVAESANTEAGVASTTQQIETATFGAATTSAAGWAKITLTSALIDPTGSDHTHVINFRVPTGANATAQAALARAAMNADPVVAANFTVGETANTTIVLTTKAVPIAANDDTLNMAIDDGDDPATADCTATTVYVVEDYEGNVKAPVNATNNKHIFNLPQGWYRYKVSKAGLDASYGLFAVNNAAVTLTDLLQAER